MSQNRSWLWGVIGAAAAVGVTLGAVSLLGDDDPAPAAGGPDGSPSQSPSQSPTTPQESPSSPAPTGSTFTVAAYFVGETGRGPRLFREFSKANATDVGVAAVDAALQGGNDPDYTSIWTQYDVRALSVVEEGGTLTVDLDVDDVGAIHDRPAGLDAESAAMAVEQLVRTAQGANQNGRVPVQLLVRGEHVDRLFGVPVAEPLSAQPDDEVLAHVWVNTPADGAQVSAGDTVEGLANSFEATVTWELRQGRTVVERGFTTAEEAFTMAPYSFELPDVPPGEYTLVISEDDPSGGAEGSGPDSDSKRLTFS